jgi:glyoxylase-like metal-dependent hydrolase (beta-lactamase superfamily II)
MSLHRRTGAELMHWVMVMRKTTAMWVGVIVCNSTNTVLAQQTVVDLEILQVQPNFYMLAGAGANIGVQVDANGVVLVNAGMAKAANDVLAAVTKLTTPNQPIRYIIDTSADPDVVGGNGKLAAAGRSITSAAVSLTARTASDAATILSHEEVLTQLSTPPENGQAPLVASDGWPGDAFSENRRAMYFNNEGIEIIHLPAAHTDGDVLVFFRKSDVIVAGNIIDADRFPMIDLAHGGSLQGEIDALNRIIEMAIPPSPYFSQPHVLDIQPGGTAVLPGRGHILRQIDVVDYRNMLVIIRDAVQDLIDQKMTLKQIKAADPAKPYKTRYGSISGTWTTDLFIEAVYNSLTSKK